MAQRIQRIAGGDRSRVESARARDHRSHRVFRLPDQRAVEEHGVRAIPTVIVNARRLVGLVDVANYRKAAEDTG
jgi:hypothetical protein